MHRIQAGIRMLAPLCELGAEGGMSMSDTEFMTHVIAEICNYAVTNGMEPDDTLGTVADNILSLLEISTFNNWAFKEE